MQFPTAVLHILRDDEQYNESNHASCHEEPKALFTGPTPSFI